MAGLAQMRILETLTAEGFHDADGLEPFLHDAHDVGLMQSNLVRRLFHRLLESADEDQQTRSDRHCNQREIPIEPEHEAEYAEDSQNVDQQTQSIRRGEILNGGYVTRDRG